MSNVYQSLGLLVLRISIKRTFNRNTNVVRISIVATCFPLRGKRLKQYVQANWIFRSVATLKSSETPFRVQRDEAYQRPSNNAQYTVVLPPQPSGQLPPMGSQDIPPLLTKSRSLQIAILVSQSPSLFSLLVSLPLTGISWKVHHPSYFLSSFRRQRRSCRRGIFSFG